MYIDYLKISRISPLLVDISNILILNSFFPKQKMNIHCTLFLQISLMFGLLVENSTIVISAPLWNILQYVILFDGYEVI